MQISCIQKHLGVFLSLVPSLLCIPSLSTYPFSSTSPPPLIFSFQEHVFASFHPFFLLLFHSFISPSQTFFSLHSYFAFTPGSWSQCPRSFLQSSPPVPPFLPSASSPSVAVYPVRCLIFIPSYLVYSKNNEEICEVSHCGSVVRGRI